MWKRVYTYALRTTREILRDPLNLAFGLGFPIILILLLSAIQANVPVELFALPSLTPGITVFGLAFMTLFSATLIARDRETAFLQRLYTTPMTAVDFVLGYTLPILPIALAQALLCYLTSLCLGLSWTIHILPTSLFFIALGLLCGSLFTVKQVGGLCGALLTNLTAWLSGVWFDIHLVGGAFVKIANALPFIHAVEMERAVLRGDFVGIFPHLWWVLGYTIVCFALSVAAFLRQMHRS